VRYVRFKAGAARTSDRSATGLWTLAAPTLLLDSSLTSGEGRTFIKVFLNCHMLMFSMWWLTQALVLVPPSSAVSGAEVDKKCQLLKAAQRFQRQRSSWRSPARRTALLVNIRLWACIRPTMPRTSCRRMPPTPSAAHAVTRLNTALVTSTRACAKRPAHPEGLLGGQAGDG
jgi:hypothetical protein